MNEYEYNQVANTKVGQITTSNMSSLFMKTLKASDAIFESMPDKYKEALVTYHELKCQEAAIEAHLDAGTKFSFDEWHAAKDKTVEAKQISAEIKPFYATSLIGGIAEAWELLKPQKVDAKGAAE